MKAPSPLVLPALAAFSSYAAAQEDGPNAAHCVRLNCRKSWCMHTDSSSVKL